MGNPEQAKPESLIEDVNEAAEGAYAEKPARDFMAAPPVEITPEQQQVLEWFASTIGEKALADYRKMKEEQKELVREKGLEVVNITTMSNLSYLNTEFKDEKDYLIKIQNTLSPYLRGELEKVFNGRGNLAEKLKAFNDYKSSLVSGIRSYSNWVLENNGRKMSDQGESVLRLGLGREGSSGRIELRGSLAAALADKNGKLVQEILSRTKKDTDFNEIVDEFKNDIGTLHTTPAFDHFMNSRNYLFNSHTNKYESSH